MLLAGVGLLLGVPLMSMGIGCLFGAIRATTLGTAVLVLAVGAMLSLVGALVLFSAEAALRGASINASNRSRAATQLAARAALLCATIAGFGGTLVRLVGSTDWMFEAPLVRIYDPAGTMGRHNAINDELSETIRALHWESVGGGASTAFWTLVPALIGFGLLSRYLVGLGTVRTRPAVLAWAGTVAALSLVAGLAWGASQLGLYSVHGASTVWRGLLWTGALSGLAAVLALVAQRRLAIWDHPERWREATVTPELRIVFADGSGDRPASEYFRGYAGPVVVMPTAEAAGAVFRGDGAPTDGWLVPGTRAALEESVRCVRAMAHLTVAAVGLMAAAPLAVWLVSLVG
jgi:hypothetical protein